MSDKTISLFGYDIPVYDYPSLDEIEGFQKLNQDQPETSLMLDVVVLLLECRLEVKVKVSELRRKPFNMRAAKQLVDGLFAGMNAEGDEEGK
jgi:hypothetical protein